MAKHTIVDLREHLFDTLAALRNKEHPMDVDRARAVAEISKVVIETAKVEVAFLKVRQGINSTGFLPQETDDTSDAPARPQLEIRSRR